MEKNMKEKEVLNIDRKMDKCLCSNVCNVCAKNLSREEREKKQISKIYKWKSQIRKERNTLYAENKKIVEELNYIKRHGHKVTKCYVSNGSKKRTRDG